MRKSYLALSLVALALAGLYAYTLLPASGNGPPLSVLKEQSRTGATAQRQAAIVRLARAGEAGAAEVTRLLRQDPDPPIRATCAQVLGDVYYYDAMDPLLEALTDHNPDVAREADTAVVRMLGINIQPLPSASANPEADRRKRQAWLRNCWNSLKDSPALAQTKARIRRQMETSK